MAGCPQARADGTRAAPAPPPPVHPARRTTRTSTSIRDRMPLSRRHTLLLTAALLFTGCGLLTGPACTLEARPALIVTVRDSTTGAPAAGAARVVARSGAFADTAHAGDDHAGPYPLAYERAGTYVLTVEHEGYRAWSRSGIRVGAGECHVRTEAVTVLLQR